MWNCTLSIAERKVSTVNMDLYPFDLQILEGSYLLHLFLSRHPVLVLVPRSIPQLLNLNSSEDDPPFY
jgi:hypothetical protein